MRSMKRRCTPAGNGRAGQSGGGAAGAISGGSAAGAWAATVLVSAGTSVLGGFDAPVSIGAGVHRLAGAGSWSVLSTIGLTETSPDLTVGLLWSVRLAR